MFGNSWGSSYTKFVTQDIKLCFTCGDLDLVLNIIKFQNIMTKVVQKFLFCSLHMQWWLNSLEEVLIWLKYVISIKKLPISKVQSFLKSNFDLNQMCKTVLTQNH